MKSAAGNPAKSGDTRISQVIFADAMQGQPSLKLTDVFRRQRWVICGFMSLGIALASLYWTKATVWYESIARIQVSQRSPELAAGADGKSRSEETVGEDVLANHMELLRSRRIVEGALKRHQLDLLPNIQSQLVDAEEDATDYVIEHLKLSRGGEGAAREASVLNVLFEHIDPKESKLVLEAIIIEYQSFLTEQLSKVMAEANTLVTDSRNALEEQLVAAQQEQLTTRQTAPVLFQGDGSSNVYVEQYRRLHEELLTLEIAESAGKSRLEKARVVLASKGDGETVEIEDLGIIDTDSLTRLGAFAGLQASSAKSAEFQAAQPERLEEARTNYSHLLRLMSDKRRLEADFGPGHPDVKKLDEEIALVKSFVDERSGELNPGWEDVQLTPGGLLKAYIAFLESDQTAMAERRQELAILLADAEKQARVLVEFELRDGILQSKIDRTQTLFDGLVDQLRELDLAAGMDGFMHEPLELPRDGKRSWPSLPLCAVGGVLLGLIGGLFMGMLNDQLDQRFRSSSEIDKAIGIPILTRVGRVRTVGALPIVSDSSPEGESFRMIRTLLLNDVRSGQLKVLSATSPLPGDGKTTILVNIAGSFAKLNMSVVLVEADMRRPTFHKRFGVPDTNGLSEVLRGLIDVDAALVPSGVSGLTLITAGAGTSNPSELLQAETFDNVLKELSARFDLVVIDVGPVLAVSDPVIVAQKSDAMLLVVRSSNDTKQQVTDAVDTLRAAGAKLPGCIVNTFGSGREFERRGYYGYYYSDRNGRNAAGESPASSDADPDGPPSSSRLAELAAGQDA